MLHRAYSTIEIKSVDDDLRVIEGIATTPSPDRMGDVVDPKGVKLKTPLPLLWQHKADQPIGQVLSAKVTAEGIAIKAQIAKGVLPRIDEAWALIKSGLVRGLSIGFRATEDPEPIKGSWGFKFTGWELLELSVVTIPANADASITAIKSIDLHDLAASGMGPQAVTPKSAGVSAPVITASKGARPMKKSYADQIKEMEATRAAKVARQEEIQAKASGEGRTKDEAEKEEFSDLKGEIKSIDDELVDLRELEASQKAAAIAVNGGSAVAPNQRPTASVITVKDNTPPGIGFARVAIAKYLSWMDHVPAREIVAERWPDDARLKNYFSKAAVPAAVTTNSTYAGNLVYADNLAAEFVEFLRPQTLVGRLPLRKVPFNIRFASQTTGAVAGWVGEGRGKPVTSASTGTGSLGYTKIAAIAVISQEMARFSSPNAESWMRDELAAAVVERLDIDFIDPAQAAVANVNPASITNGLTALSSAGTSADNIRTDLQNLLEQFIAANMGVSGVVLIMPETLALAASLLTNAFGQPEFPTLTPTGGTLRGIPVYTTQYAANQSGGGNLVIALKPNEIALADDGQVDVSVSTEASVEMSDAPTNRSDTPTAASLVSLWQTNSIGIKAERFVNWTKRRTGAVVYMDDANWGSIGSPS
jgi:HK97 family phage major capsid protein/HK97 family phage prohead protease